MRHPYDEAGCWIARFGPGYSGLGSGGTNTVQWSIRTTADAAVGGYDWAVGVLENSGGQGEYVVVFPADVVGAAGRYEIAARTSPGGPRLSEELLFGQPEATAAELAAVSAVVAEILDRVPTIRGVE